MGTLTEEPNEGTIQKNRKRKQPAMSYKMKKRKQNSLTAEEVNNLKEAEIMFHSNLFKMQVNELLEGLREKVAGEKIREWLEKLKNFIKNIPESSECTIAEFSLGAKVAVPILQNPKSSKGVFKFIPPVEILDVGSFLLDTMCSPVIDIAVEIPKGCLHGSDFLNHCYHRKRAFYLAYIAHNLLDVDFVDKMQFCYQNECYLKPVLLITPKGIENLTICLTAYPYKGLFKLSRFIPRKNNVRSSWFLGEDEDALEDTPYHNSTVQSDVLLPDLNNYLKEVISNQSVKDGLILLKLWCSQRGLTNGYGKLNGFILTLFVAYLIKKKRITSLMSAYQVFRCTLITLQDKKILQNGINLCDDENKQEEFRNLFDVLFIETSGLLNVCYHVTKETLDRVQHEAKIGLSILEKEASDCFNDLFLHEITFNKKFEYLLRFRKQKQFKKYVQKLDLVKKTLDLGEDYVACVIPKICDLLRTGLSDRISLIDVSKKPNLPWPVSKAPPSPNGSRVTIGFLMNPAVSLNNLEKGPLADDPKAKEFREFWGDRSQLRRFQDSTIREAVFWPANTTSEKRKVFSSIITDVLARHIGAERNHIQVFGTEVDCALQIPDGVLSADCSPYGTGEEAHMTLMQSFHALSKELRALKGLPLLIASIQGSSAPFRYSEVFPPLSVTHTADPRHTYVDGLIMKLKDTGVGVPPFTQALKVVLTLEGTGKWPDDVEAIKRVKAAFHIKIAELIKAQFSLLAIPSETHADIFKDGFVFRIQVACHKEIYLLKQVKTALGTVKIQENKESRALEMETVTMPKITSILHGINQQYSTFGTACRLAKRWISAQLKYAFVQESTLELIVAYLYLHPEPFTPPCSPQVAFIRFLTLLANHDWSASPLIVNLNNEFTVQDIEEIHSSFISQRLTLPPMVIPTPLDKRGSMWTKNMPSAPILKRIALLAKSSLEVLNEVLDSTKLSDVKALFRPSLETFDVIIYLKRIEVPTLTYAVDVLKSDPLPLCKPYKQEMNELFPIVEYNPVKKYLEELKENFGDFAIFLHDIYGGDTISVMWKRSAFTAKEFKPSSVYCRTLYGDGSRVILDVERILEDFKILGTGIVKEIVKQTENWQIP